MTHHDPRITSSHCDVTLHNPQWTDQSHDRVAVQVMKPLAGELLGLFCPVRTHRQHLLPSAAQHFSERSAAALACQIAPLPSNVGERR